MAASLNVRKDAIVTLEDVGKVQVAVSWEESGRRRNNAVEVASLMAIFRADSTVETIDAREPVAEDRSVLYRLASDATASREVFTVDLAHVDDEVTAMFCALTAYTSDALRRVRNPTVMLLSADGAVGTEQELCRFSLAEAVSDTSVSAIVACRLFCSSSGKWKLAAHLVPSQAADDDALNLVLKELLDAEADDRPLNLSPGDVVYFGNPPLVRIDAACRTSEGAASGARAACLFYSAEGKCLGVLEDDTPPSSNLRKGNTVFLTSAPSAPTATTAQRRGAASAGAASATALSAPSGGTAAPGYDHALQLDLESVSASVKSLVLVVHAFTHAASATRMARSRLQLSNPAQKKTIAQLEADHAKNMNAAILAVVYRDAQSGRWAMRAVGQPVKSTSAFAGLDAPVQAHLADAAPKPLELQRGDLVLFEGPRKVAVRLCWMPAGARMHGAAFALDSRRHVVEYIEDRSASGAVAVAADPEDANESVVSIELSLVPASTAFLVFVLFVDRASARASSASMALVNAAAKPAFEIATYETELHGSVSAVVLGVLSRAADPTKWGVKMLGAPVKTPRPTEEDLHAAIDAALADEAAEALVLEPADVLSFHGPRLAELRLDWETKPARGGAVGPHVPLDGLCLCYSEAGAILAAFGADVAASVAPASPSAGTAGLGRRAGGVAAAAAAAGGDDDVASAVQYASEDSSVRFTVELGKVPADCAVLVFALVASERDNFGSVRAVTLRLADASGGQARELAQFSCAKPGMHTGIVLGLMHRDSARRGKWKLQAVGDAVAGSPVGLMRRLARAAADGSADPDAPRSLDLRKNDLISFEGPTEVFVGLSWALRDDRAAVELDAACWIVDDNSTVIDSIDASNEASPCGAIVRSVGRTPDGLEEEQLRMNLAAMSLEYNALVFVLSARTPGGLDRLVTPRVRLVDVSGKRPREIACYAIEPASEAQAHLLGVIAYRDPASALKLGRRQSQGSDPSSGRWKLKAVGTMVAGRSPQDAVNGWSRAQRGKIAPKRVLLNRGDVLTFEGAGRVIVGLGWDVEPDSPTEVAAAAVLVSTTGQPVGVVQAGNRAKWPRAPLPELDWDGVDSDEVLRAGLVLHSGASGQGRAGAGAGAGAGAAAGDVESLFVELDLLPPDVGSVVLVLMTPRGLNFSSVAGCYCRLINASSAPKREIAMLDMACAGDHNGMVMASLQRDPTDPARWRFRAVGNQAIGSTYEDMLAYLDRARNEAGPSRLETLELQRNDMVLFDGAQRIAFEATWHLADDDAVLDSLSLACYCFNVQGELVDYVDGGRPMVGEDVLTHEIGAAAGGAAESVLVALNALSPQTKSLIMVLTAFGASLAPLRSVSFALSDDPAPGEARLTIARHEVGLPDAPTAEAASGLLLAVLYREDDTGKWKLRAVGDALKKVSAANVAGALQAQLEVLLARSLSLAPGDIVSFEGARRLVAGFGWDAVRGPRTKLIGLSACCLLIDGKGALREVVHAGAPNAADGGCVRMLGAETGRPAVDDAAIELRLEAMPASVHHVLFAITSFARPDFAATEHVYMRLCDGSGVPEREIAKFDLVRAGEGSHAALLLARLFREPATGLWRLQALGDPADGETHAQLMPAVLPHLGVPKKQGCCCAIM